MQVLIIGAGPGGLALAQQLKQRNIESLILDKSDRVGNTFYTMAANTTYGPWLNNRMPDGPVRVTRLLSRTRREQYAEYLAEYAVKHDLDFRTGVTVQSVRKHPAGFELETDQGPFVCSLLVNASGYFSKPYVPEIPGATQSSVPQLHSSEFKGVHTVRTLLGKNRGRVLVVGGRLSAGETMAALHYAGYKVTISHGKPIDFFPPTIFELCMAPLTQVMEGIRVRIPGTTTPWNLNVRMNGDDHRKMIESGEVPLVPEIARFEGETLVFTDGRQDHFDLVIYATGYRPALDHLAGLVTVDPETNRPPLKAMESTEAPGLFFLGLIGLRTFRSQFLRGLRDDSRVLAKTLESRLATLPAPARDLATA
ncbi:MAG: hypothetical protein AMXMBFR33_53140 [Candidatus Xenobia bacterium]